MDISIITYNIHGLPWIRCPVEAIAAWVLQKSPDIVCFQELFKKTDRAAMTRFLEAGAYTVSEPRDDIGAGLSSGLLTAHRRHRFRPVTSSFQPFFDTLLEDSFANKGFHRLVLEDPAFKRTFSIFNTHLQSNVELRWLIGGMDRMRSIRSKQAAQILAFADDHDAGIPALLVGDLNTHTDPHRYMRILHPPDDVKVTFPATGENLDHVAWMPLQWSGDCGMCAVLGPRCVECRVHTEAPWSDHVPVEYTIYLPQHQRGTA
jgi:endonuclease/exonuclease/phosphatase family metal-dependent hydrolase